jgi:catechol 2,3-dioxygenase-like lactoylglutathione lyase family enzyme
MSESLKSVGAITMFVDDPKRSKEFYERVFDASAIYEDENSVAFEFEKLIVNLLAERAAPELIEPTPVAGRETGERFQLTIWVEDADAVVEQLRSAGVELLNGPIDRPWGLRTAAFADPDGHVWEVAAKIG